MVEPEKEQWIQQSLRHDTSISWLGNQRGMEFHTKMVTPGELNTQSGYNTGHNLEISCITSLSHCWLIPIAVLFIISFPPLFGHGIITILYGLVWGLGVGFAIVAVGTFLGELGHF